MDEKGGGKWVLNGVEDNMHGDKDSQHSRLQQNLLPWDSCTGGHYCGWPDIKPQPLPSCWVWTACKLVVCSVIHFQPARERPQQQGP